MPIRTVPTYLKGNVIEGAKRVERFLGCEWFDDFFGDVLDTRYTPGGDGNETIQIAQGADAPSGLLEISNATAPPVDAAGVSLGNDLTNPQFRARRNSIFEAAVIFRDLTQVRFVLGFDVEGPSSFNTTVTTSMAAFIYNAGAAVVNFFFRTTDNSVGSNDDTEFEPALDTLYIFRIQLSSTKVDWSIMNSSRTVLASGSKTTNWPPASAVDLLEAIMGLRSLEAVEKKMHIDYLYLSSDRSG